MMTDGNKVTMMRGRMATMRDIMIFFPMKADLTAGNIAMTTLTTSDVPVKRLL